MQIVIVNACNLLSDGEVVRIIPGLQDDMDNAFLPSWHGFGPPGEVDISAVGWDQFHAHEDHYMADDIFPIFLNRHSIDPGALGWHTDEGKKIFGRVFVGDCMRYGISWTTDLSHEIHEIVADPNANRYFQMPDGRWIALETDDPVEADAQARLVKGTMISNFVFPEYFSDNTAANTRYDQQGFLHKPAPEITEGGYASIWTPGQGYSQIQMDRQDGLLGRRVLMPARWRLAMRKQTGPTEEFKMAPGIAPDAGEGGDTAEA